MVDDTAAGKLAANNSTMQDLEDIYRNWRSDGVPDHVGLNLEPALNLHNVTY
jgi:hypothetical protein